MIVSACGRRGRSIPDFRRFRCRNGRRRDTGVDGGPGEAPFPLPGRDEADIGTADRSPVRGCRRWGVAKW